MDIKTYNAKEYVLLYLGLCISMPQVWRKGAEKIKLPFKEATLQQVCSELKKEKLIRYDKQNKNIFLTPKGIEEIGAICPEVMSHYMLVSQNHSVSGEVKTKYHLRTASINQMFIDGEINGLTLRYIDNSFNSAKEADEIEKNLPFGKRDVIDIKNGYPGFSQLFRDSNINGTHIYTSRIIKNDRDLEWDREQKLYLAKSGAFLIKNGKPYMVFTGGTLDQFAPLVERRYFEKLINEYGKVFGDKSKKAFLNKSPAGEAIILYDHTEDIVSDFFYQREITLCKLYTKCYIVPRCTNNELNIKDGEYVLRLLEIEDIENKIKEILYSSNGEGDIDGFSGGVPSWEFLTSDFGKLNRIQKEKKAVIACYSWQREAINELLPNTDITFKVLSNKEALVKKLKGEM